MRVLLSSQDLSPVFRFSVGMRLRFRGGAEVDCGWVGEVQEARAEESSAARAVLRRVLREMARFVCFFMGGLEGNGDCTAEGKAGAINGSQSSESVREDEYIPHSRTRDRQE